MSKIEAVAEQLAAPVCEAQGCFLYDVEFKKEGADTFLRVFIDADGGVTVDMCEAVSRALEAALDSADPISEPYILEVSSPGIERALKKDWHYDAAVGKDVTIKLFRPIDGQKVITAKLVSHDKGIVTIQPEGGEKLRIEKGKIAKANLAFAF